MWPWDGIVSPGSIAVYATSPGSCGDGARGGAGLRGRGLETQQPLTSSLGLCFCCCYCLILTGFGRGSWWVGELERGYPSKWEKTTKAGHPRERGRGWDPGTLNSVEFVSSMHTSALAWGEVRARKLRGRPSPQGVAMGSGSSCRRPPHTAPLCLPTAQLMTATPILNQKAEGFRARWKEESGLPGSPPGQLPWPLCPHPLSWALSAGPNLSLCVGVLGLSPQGPLEWLQHRPPPTPPHSPPELGD